MRTKILMSGIALLALAFMTFWLWPVTVMTDLPKVQINRQLSQTPEAVSEQQVTQPELMAIAQTEGVVTNYDGSVTITGSASFTMTPVSSSPPPVQFVPEAEAKKLSSPPQ